jgi:uncharacterized protein with NAD-binding domain and iron-sulfur cluster
MGDKIKVAVLGGGVGAMSAALALSEIDPKGEKYEITLHHLGWRLGGKCASGRNPRYGQRIEEHGLHIWAGAYDNAFTIMRTVFKALNRPLGHPLATIGDAFKRQDQFFLTMNDNGEWSPWSFWFKPDDDPSVFPGADGLWANDPLIPPIATLINRVLAWIESLLPEHGLDPLTDLHAVTMGMISDLPQQAQVLIVSSSSATLAANPLLAAASSAAQSLETGDQGAPDLEWEHVAELLRCALFVLVPAYLLTRGQPGGSPERKIFELSLIGVLMVVGIIDNDCIVSGFHTIDQFDFREFLLNASPALLKDAVQEFLSDTVMVRAFYDYAFAYQGGDRTRPRLSACSAVQSLLRLGLTYKGAFFFKATAGFGDTVFTPIYQLLKSRGATFCFFHSVTDLVPSADGAMIETILIDQQCALAPGVTEYEPLAPVKGIDCWPSSPRWGQILDGAKFEAEGVNFEEFYSPQPPPFAKLRLQRGRDFDQVILGIPVGALGAICKGLADQKQGWADMVLKLETARTQSLQLWVDRATDDLGGPFVAPPEPPETLCPIVTGYEPPLDTYSDMSQLNPAEDWPPPAPLSVAYFCGVMGDDAAPNDTKLATEKVRQDALAWTTSRLEVLWTDADEGADFQWNLLHAQEPATGETRFDQQFWRANISPSERYVLSLPNTLEYRLESGKSGYGNLFLAGDWTKTPDVNVGAVEVAAMSGLAAASALSGVKIPIVCGTWLYGPPAAAAQ